MKNMVSETYTFGEFRALKLLYGKYSHVSIHKAANEIIALAEQIKAERAVVAMQKPPIRSENASCNCPLCAGTSGTREKQNEPPNP